MTASAAGAVSELINRKFVDKVRTMMRAVADHQSSPAVVEPAPQPAPAVMSGFDEAVSFFCGTERPGNPILSSANRVDEELNRWMTDPPVFTDNALRFWKDQDSEHNFKYLAQVAKAVYAVPTSSAQIERDFGQSDRLVTPPPPLEPQLGEH